MSEVRREYVVDLSNVPVRSSEGFGCFALLQGLPVLEQIIRCKDCKDCKHYELDGMYKGCCLLHLERMTGYDPLSDSGYDNDIGMYEMPPDGFCSSAERRDA